MTVSKTGLGGFAATENSAQGAGQSRLDGRPRRCTPKDNLEGGRVRRWLKSAHRSFGSWAKVTSVMGLSSKGQAQHIAEGRAPVTDGLRRAYRERQAFIKAGRWLAGRINEQGTLGTHQPQDVAAHDRAAGSAAGADRGVGREPGAA
jgi:hypothetical protein